ncbi:PA2779 family protein [Aquabacterium parvum]|uniref:PA2779 family protein n=1 Tax=Aquabacterium parvum TaxID=70584 RepID=UPI000718E0AE|nr:PA2779 family protein [Aquabacterium parvum]
MSRTRKALALTVALALSHTAGLQAAHAGMIATDAVAAQVAQAEAHASAESRRANVLATLHRTDVAQALAAKGVDMDAARARIASLSDAEVMALADQLDHAPAGASDVLGVIVFIFLVLLVTDILGFTKVFPFTRSIR